MVGLNLIECTNIVQFPTVIIPWQFNARIFGGLPFIKETLQYATKVYLQMASEWIVWDTLPQKMA